MDVYGCQKQRRLHFSKPWRRELRSMFSERHPEDDFIKPVIPVVLCVRVSSRSSVRVAPFGIFSDFSLNTLSDPVIGCWGIALFLRGAGHCASSHLSKIRNSTR